MADAKKKDLALLLAGKYTAADPVLEDGDVQYLRMDENGRLLLNAIVTAEVADSKIKGSPDGQTWVPVKLDAEGNVMVKFPAAQEVTVSGASAAEGGTPPINILAVGGRYDATPRSLSDGQHGAMALSLEGRPIVEMQSQQFNVMNQDIAPSATVKTDWVDVNGYNKIGLFIHISSATNWKYRVEVSPDGDGFYMYHPTTGEGVEKTSTNGLTELIDGGYTRHMRLVITNQGAVERRFRAWMQLVF